MSIVSTIQRIIHHPLNKKRRVRSLYDYLRWQIGSRLVGGSVVHTWIGGVRLLVRRGETGLTGNVYMGLDEFQDMAFVLHVLRGEDLFCDVGANAGSYSVLACGVRGASGVAFEPVPDAFRRLQDNIRLNRIEQRVDCLNVAVGDREGVLQFTNSGDTVNRALVSGEEFEGAIQTRVTTLDRALVGRRPTIIKIDVEGFETAVVEGGRTVLENDSVLALIVELNGAGVRYGWDEQQLREKLFRFGFEPRTYDPFTRDLVREGFGPRYSGNTIFVRGESTVAERLAAAPKVLVNDIWI